MNIWGVISAQFGKPTGVAGGVAGMIMANRRSNRERIDWAISLLNLRRDDRVLEIGFGPGIALQKMSEIVKDGVIWGVDHSEVMIRQASKRNRVALQKGRVKLILGKVSNLPSLDAQLNKVLDINSFQFWQSPLEDLRMVRRLMVPGGLIVLVHQPRKPGSTDKETDRAGREFADYLVKAGFRGIAIKKRAMNPVSTVCVLGRA